MQEIAVNMETLLMLALILLAAYLLTRRMRARKRSSDTLLPALSRHPAPTSDTAPRNGARIDLDRFVARVLRQSRRQKIKVVYPAIVLDGTQMVQMMVALVGQFGVLGVRCVGFGGVIHAGESATKWKQERGGASQTIPNYARQAAADSITVQSALTAAGLPGIPVEVVTVFTTPGVQLIGSPSQRYCTVDGFFELLKRPRFAEDRGVSIDTVVTRLTELTRENMAILKQQEQETPADTTAKEESQPGQTPKA